MAYMDREVEITMAVEVIYNGMKKLLTTSVVETTSNHLVIVEMEVVAADAC